MKYTVKASPTDTILNIADPVVTVEGTPPPPVNHAPVVVAGIDQSIVLPINSVTLTGKATDPDTGGTIQAYMWERRTGSGTIEAPNSSTTKISGLKAGTSVFRLTAIDNLGASGFDDINIVVSDSAVTPPPGDYGTLIYSNGFDTQKELDPFGNGQIGNGSLSTSVKMFGTGSFKSVPANVSSGIRSEVQLDRAQTPTEGTLDYYAMYETIFSGSGHSLQAHPGTSGGSASPGLWHEDGQFVLVNWKGGTNTKYPTGFKIPRNVWLHIVLQYKFGSSGYLKLTINDAVVLDKKGIQVGDGSSMYWKIGVNMWQVQNSVVYYDQLKVYKR